MDPSTPGLAEAAANGPDWVHIATLSVLGIIALAMLFSMFFTVEQQTSAVVERFGKFVRIAGPGLNVKLPFIESVNDKVNLRTQQLVVACETKTKDNVFVKIDVAVQYRVPPEKVYDAAYKLDDPEEQIESYVLNAIRAHVPKSTLDEVFEQKEELADAVKAALQGAMDGYGYAIVNALVSDIVPDDKVKAAMNEINAAQRLRVAANEKGEAEKTLAVKAAEAEAESKRLQGQGTANQRKAIALGIEQSLETLRRAGVNPHEATVMMLMTQYLDMLHAVGAQAGTNTILLPHSPGAVGSLMQEIVQAIAVGNTATPPLPDSPPTNGVDAPAAAAA